MFEKNIAPEYRVHIRDLPKEQVLAALYNRASPQGMGILMYKSDVMTARRAFSLINFRGDDSCFMPGENPRNELRNEFYFDYLFGRALKVDISGDVFSSKIDRLIEEQDPLASLKQLQGKVRCRFELCYH